MQSSSFYWGKNLFAFIYLNLMIGGYGLFGQTNLGLQLQASLDSLIKTQNVRPFNGVILVAQNGLIQYENTHGFSDFEKYIPFKTQSRFVVGSLSKQITAVLVLRALDQGKLTLNAPIRTYLPKLTQKWADSVTIHHLLNHTSGIINVDSPLAFRAGTQFSYSGLGYKLLGDIVENVTHKSLEVVVNELFKFCKMKNSAYPSAEKQKLVIKGYTHQKDGSIQAEKETFVDNYAAAGLFISSPLDLLKWNEYLHGGKLLKDSTYQKMISPSSSRQHPVWGNVGYGYGLQLQTQGNVMEIGHGGYVAGFVSTNFYYPKTKTSVIILENMDWKSEDFKQNFHFESLILKMVQDKLQNQ